MPIENKLILWIPQLHDDHALVHPKRCLELPRRMAKPARSAPPGRIDLASSSTTAGAMKRLFLLEAVSPGYGDTCDETENLPAMRLMRRTIENRLKAPGTYGAPGATSETDVIELGNSSPALATPRSSMPA